MQVEYTRQQFVRVCACGCGEPTLLHRQSWHAIGVVAKTPQTWVAGHQLRRHFPHNANQTDARGYFRRFVPGHPNASKHGFVYEHRLIVEAHIGRYLTRNEEVHHIDGNKSNNNIDNLRVMTKASHRTLHHKGKPKSRPHRSATLVNSPQPRLDNVEIPGH